MAGVTSRNKLEQTDTCSPLGGVHLCGGIILAITLVLGCLNMNFCISSLPLKCKGSDQAILPLLCTVHGVEDAAANTGFNFSEVMVFRNLTVCNQFPSSKLRATILGRFLSMKLHAR